MRPVELALEACRQTGIEPFSAPVRGGTDGSRLTEMGVPCPNLFTGMQEIHGPREWVSVAGHGRLRRACACGSPSSGAPRGRARLMFALYRPD